MSRRKQTCGSTCNVGMDWWIGGLVGVGIGSEEPDEVGDRPEQHEQHDDDAPDVVVAGAGTPLIRNPPPQGVSDTDFKPLKRLIFFQKK